MIRMRVRSRSRIWINTRIRTRIWIKNRNRIRNRIWMMVAPVRGWLEEELRQLQWNLELASAMARLARLCWLAP